MARTKYEFRSEDVEDNGEFLTSATLVMLADDEEVGRETFHASSEFPNDGPAHVLAASAGWAWVESMEYTLDGAHHVDPYDGYPSALPFPDALAEFKTEIGGQTASQLRGAQVSAVTKSGTNEFHGDLFEFVRNDLFNARSYFSLKGSTLKRNQFGGTVGGPILKNRLLFFGGYQETTLRQDPADQRQFVPTAAMLAGLRFARRTFRPATVPFELVLLVFPGLFYVTHASIDYRHPIEPLVVCLVAVTAVHVFDRHRIASETPRVHAVIRPLQ